MAFRTPRCGAFNCLVTVSRQRLERPLSYSASARSQNKEHISAVEEVGIKVLPPRWLSDLKRRIGRCISFGLRPEQVRRAGDVLKVVSREWRDLVAGSEGFLTGPDRAGLQRHRVVWGDMDSMHHVNNVMYTKYAESARVNWILNFAMHIDPDNKKEWSELLTPNGNGLILKSIRTDYKFPMTWPDRVAVYHKLRSPPTALTDSFMLDVIILSEKEQRASARCVEDIVVYDYRKSKKTYLQPFMAEALKETFRLQEEMKAKKTEQILNLLRQAETLEKESWDREGAKEDFGSAG